MEKYCLENFFKILSCRGIPIKYITQNKEKNKLKESCFEELLKTLFNKKLVIPNGVYFAITNETVVKLLKKKENVTLIKILCPAPKSSIDGLKQYLISEETKCSACKKRQQCEQRYIKPSEKKKHYFVFFKVK